MSLASTCTVRPAVRRGLLVTLAVALVATLAGPARPAAAAYPGTNGTVAFERGSDIWLVEPDGSGLRNLTATGALFEKNPVVSPDGNWVAFESDTTNPLVFPEIHVVRTDGSARRVVAAPGGDLYEARNPTWSPDGTYIAFDGYQTAERTQSLWVVEADGDGPEPFQLTSDVWAEEPAWSVDGEIYFPIATQGLWALDPFAGTARLVYEGDPYLFSHPDVSPDGSQVVFECSDWPFACIVDADGSNFRILNYPGVGEGGDAPRRRVTQPHFSPDGTAIIFSGDDPHGEPGTSLHVLPVTGFTPDNGGTTLLTPGPAEDFSPSWGPVSTGEPAPGPGPGPGPGEPAFPNACPDPVAPGFADTAGNTHEAAIGCIVQLAVTQGFPDGTYRPAGGVTRGQLASFVARALDRTDRPLPAAGPQGFTDIAGNPHADNINRLAAAGIVSGTSATTYAPGAEVRRDQMATFLVNAYEYVAGPLPTPSGDLFTDIAGNTHRQSINKAGEAGFAGGTGQGLYTPGQGVRRDQMGSFLARQLDRLAGEQHMTP